MNINGGDIMLNYKVKIGLVPMRRNTTNRPAKTFLTWVSAEERGHRFVDYIEKNFKSENVTFTDSKGLGCSDLIFDDKSAAELVEHFKAEEVDAVVIINCNFGNEEAADIAKALGKPVLLWAPLDDEYYEDGMRPTRSAGFSGFRASSRDIISHFPICPAAALSLMSLKRTLTALCALPVWLKTLRACV